MVETDHVGTTQGCSTGNGCARMLPAVLTVAPKAGHERIIRLEETSFGANKSLRSERTGNLSSDYAAFHKKCLDALEFRHWAWFPPPGLTPGHDSGHP